MDTENFKELLNKEYTWPAVYSFKFIVPQKNVEEVTKLFPADSTKQNPSKNGNYVSVKAKVEMPSADAIADIYTAASNIEGLIAL
jgi:putative lipoic acid-binding regulatory protein